MTEPTPGGLTEEELDFLRGVFDLAREGDVALLTAHVDAGLPVDLTNGAGDTLLLLAAYHRHTDLVRALLERGADHARVNDRGQTALAAAVFRQDTDAVTALLAAGADPARGRQSALATAVVFELSEMLALLPRPEPLVRPATGDDLAAVERIVQDAYEGYVPRIGRRPAPMDSDYGALVAAGQVWVATVGGDAAADVLGLLVLDEAVDHLLVENLAVAPHAQGRGVGGLLLRHAEARARATGLPEVRLHTHEAMVETIAYYPRRGYRETHRQTHRQTDDGFARVFFTKVLAGGPAGPGPVGGGP